MTEFLEFLCKISCEFSTCWIDLEKQVQYTSYYYDDTERRITFERDIKL